MRSTPLEKICSVDAGFGASEWPFSSSLPTFCFCAEGLPSFDFQEFVLLPGHWWLRDRVKWKVHCVRMHQRYITHIDMTYTINTVYTSNWQMYLWYAHTDTVAALRGTILTTALNPFLLSFTYEPYHQHFSKVRRFQKVIVAPLLRLGHPLARVDRKLRCQHPGSKNEGAPPITATSSDGYHPRRCNIESSGTGASNGGGRSREPGRSAIQE